ncbi:MAG: twin-arginine translocase TatA/TatE family subunit [Flavobacteriales bacterium]|jgi:sec-independent protein translocase protein TatA|nr:twin-arginine translocase TatA/TatE family subunit [Flavobacteriales bacterium]|tara:strand:- start:2386 stop:2598 length:213 start_codon:yes stop_codon:yes gene_type:complete
MNIVFLTFAIFGMSSGTEWIIIGLAILLLFGGRKIPELMKGLGGGIKEFKKATKDDSNEAFSSDKEQNKE